MATKSKQEEGELRSSIKPLKPKGSKTWKLTQSASEVAPGTNTLMSIDFAVVIAASKESLLKYNWAPDVLSTEIVGAEPLNIRKVDNQYA